MNNAPEDNAAETEAVLSLQEAPTADSADESEVQAHLSTSSVQACTTHGTTLAL
ncbi:hypothetical protein [Kitasatospora griseola]|uniref:hypothetical protein n=1 Tax=Kitasatospora griseola TaxID=2064 RepID=UPI000ABA211E|nr:hypothetical protein [Kitasatospora griseola]